MIPVRDDGHSEEMKPVVVTGEFRSNVATVTSSFASIVNIEKIIKIKLDNAFVNFINKY